MNDKKMALVGAASMATAAAMMATQRAISNQLVTTGEVTVLKASAMGKSQQIVDFGIVEAIDGGLTEKGSPPLDKSESSDTGSILPTPTVDSEGLPNRVSLDRTSKHYLNTGGQLGLRFNGEEATNCVEFCVSEGWVRLGPPGVDRVSHQQVKDATKVYGKVEPYWKVKPSRQVRRQIAREAR